MCSRPSVCVCVFYLSDSVNMFGYFVLFAQDRLHFRPPEAGSHIRADHGLSSLGSELWAPRIFSWVSAGMETVQDALKPDKVSQKKPFSLFFNQIF